MAKTTPLQLTRSQLSVNLKMDGRTLAKRLTNVKPCRSDNKSDFYYLWDVCPAIFAPDKELGGDHLALTANKSRLAEAQAIRIEVENAIKSEQIADMEEVLATWQEFIAATRAKLLALPVQVANQVAGLERDEIEEVCKSLVHEALNEMSRDA